MAISLRLTLSGTLVIGAIASACLADEDLLKLKNLLPPYLGPGVTGQHIADPGHGPRGPEFPAGNMTLLSWLPPSVFGSPETFADCTGYTAPSGREYAIIGNRNGTHFVEITDPVNPQIVGFVDGPDGLWRDVEVKAGYCYAVSESGAGVQVIDIRNIDAPTERIRFVANRTPNGYTTTHTLVTNPDTPFLYICGSNINAVRSLAVLSVEADPENPVFAGQWSQSGARYAHEAQVVSYTSGPFAGREIAYSFFINGGGVDILDVTDKTNIFRVATANEPRQAGSHQGWLSADARYLYVDDELDENRGVTPSLTRIFDVANPAAPVFAGTFTSGLIATDHNQYVRGRLLFQSNYESGLRVWDISQPLAPVEIAFFDTAPDRDALGYNGQWGSYPFFPSGTIICSDMQRGLFVLRLNDDHLVSFTYQGPTTGNIPPDEPYPLTINVAAVGAPLDPSSVQLHVQINAGDSRTFR